MMDAPMPIEDTYRTNDGRALFTFMFVEETGGNWRVDIQSQPSYGGRDSGLHASHRLSSSSARTGHKICFDRPECANNYSKAKSYAETWAEATWAWIRDGIRVKGF